MPRGDSLAGPRGFLPGEHSLREKDMSKFQISPNVQFGIGLGVTLMAVASKGSVVMPMGIPPIVGQYIDSWSNFLLFWYAPVATYMAAYSSSQPGWMAPPDPPAVVEAQRKVDVETKAAAGVVGALLVGLLFAGALALGAPQAHAASSSATPNVSGPMIDPLHLGTTGVTPATPGATAKADDSLFSRIASLVTQDFAHAASDAIAEPTVQDGNGYVCATAWQPLASIIKRHPSILSGQIADDLEGARLVIGAFGQICKVQACQTVASDEAAIAAKALSILPVSNNLPAPINIFAKTCNDLPNIVLVPPPAGAAATPAASPSPAPTAQ